MIRSISYTEFLAGLNLANRGKCVIGTMYRTIKLLRHENKKLKETVDAQQESFRLYKEQVSQNSKYDPSREVDRAVWKSARGSKDI